MERRFRAIGRDKDRVAYRRCCRATNKLITESRRCHFQQRLNECTDPRSRWRTVNELLHKNDRVLGTDIENERLCATFSAYFRTKIDSLKQSIALTLSLLTSLPYLNDIAFTGHPLTHIPPVTVAEVATILKSIPSKSSPMDFIATSLIKSCHGVFSELISRLANLSFNEGQFPSRFKTAQITPLFKKLDSTDLYLKTTDLFPILTISLKFSNVCS